MNSNINQQAKWSTNRPRSPRLNHPQHGSNRTIPSKPGSVPSSKPSYDHMQAWQHLPKETQNALPKSYWQVASMKSLNISSTATNDSQTEDHPGVFSSLIQAIDEELKEWQTTTTNVQSTNSSPFRHSPQQPHEQSPHDSAIDLNDFAWASTPKSASGEDGPRRALRMLEGRDEEDSPTVPPLFSNVPRTNSFNDNDDSSFHVTRSNVYRAAGWERGSIDTVSLQEQKPLLIAETSKKGKGMNASTGNETTCVGATDERTAAENGNPGSVRRAIRKLRRVSKFGAV
ncbi:uncharacterized protein RHO25_003889 [Cercospora beticola]|uniref:Developmental regulatory protein wetA n=1 Tax=Cercospora beticola TaxID=122368 RepID=A0ABZ0NIA6_CERBT|nr:hypothetical protein RHO25_003889 [Cercospora beticola]CAK1360589.1 unnamed protein product [Cercospora beticola]